MTEPCVQDLMDKQAIVELLYRYCRGLDRMDKVMAREVFHPDCPLDYHGIYQGTGYGFIDWVWEAHLGLARHAHQIHNTLIEVTGSEAVCEAYVTVVLWPAADESGSQTEIVARGRYLDRLKKHQGRWQIVEREYVQDTHSVYQPIPGEVSEHSRRDHGDASWKFFARENGTNNDFS